MRLLVTGGRDYSRVGTLCAVLDALHEKFGITYLIEGGATGTDMIAGNWADRKGIERDTYPALWNDLSGVPKSQIGYHSNGKMYNMMAGIERNSIMLTDGIPDMCLATLGGKGTTNMIDTVMENSEIPVFAEQVFTHKYEWLRKPTSEWLLEHKKIAPAVYDAGRYSSRSLF